MEVLEEDKQAGNEGGKGRKEGGDEMNFLTHPTLLLFVVTVTT